MSEKITALFDSGKLVRHAWFFGCVALGIAAVAGMAWAYCGPKPEKQKLGGAAIAGMVWTACGQKPEKKRCEAGEPPDTHAAEKGADQ